MAAKNYYLTNSLDAEGWCALSESTQTAATTGTGWSMGTGSTGYSELQSGSERATNTFADTPVYPDGSLNTSLKDAFRTPLLDGSFANANWTFHFVVRAVSNGGSQDGRVRLRIIKADADGSNATEITGAAQNCAIVTNITTSADFDSSLTFNPGAFSVSKQYLFFQLAWERTGAGGMATADCDFRTGSSSSAGTRITTSDFTPNQDITGVGNIASAEAFGTDKLNFALSGFGAIASLEAFGSSTVSQGVAGQDITDAGAIASLEAFGSDQLNLGLSGFGNIASLEAFGSQALHFTLSGFGAITSAEAFGSSIVQQGVPDPQDITGVGAIASAEAFGTQMLAFSISGVGAIASLEAFGSGSLSFTLLEVGAIATDEAFGNADVFTVGGGQFVTDAGAIPTEEAFGTGQLDFTITGVGNISGGGGGGGVGFMLFSDD